MRSSQGSNDPADLVITGASVYTMDAARRWAEAVAIKSGRIVAVGPEQLVRDRVGSATEVVQVPGGMVLPGFQDSHVHPDHGGMVRARCDLHELAGREAYESAIRSYADSYPDAEWILGGGWSLDSFPGGTPHRSILDAIVPDRPALLINRDGHGAWVNSRALEMAGVSAQTADPPDGRIERDADGTPAGTLHEGAMDLVENHVPDPTDEEREEGLLVGQAYLHSLGITGWQDAWVPEEALRAYRALADRGQLTARVSAGLWWERDKGEEQIEELIERRSWGTTGRLRAGSVKIMQDGIPENFTAGMIDAYLDPATGEPTERRGLSFVEPEPLKAYVTRLDSEGFQVHFHGIGDRAIREALDAIQVAQETNGRRDLRHHIAHIQIVHPDDLPRFRALGVVANAQPFWACLDGQMRKLCVPILGPERVGWQYPFASLRRSGATLAFGSDWPVTTPDPLRIMQVAITRVPEGEPDVEVFLAEERLDLPATIEAFTMGSAFVNHLENETGSVEVGKLADLCILDRNLFDLGDAPLTEATVLMTLVNGETVYSTR